MLLDCSGESRNLKTTLIAKFPELIHQTPHGRDHIYTSNNHKISSNETQLGPPKGMVPGLTPAATEGDGWTWRTTNDESEEDDESLRLSRAHLRASILTSLPSTATTTQFKLPETSMTSSISLLCAKSFCDFLQLLERSRGRWLSRLPFLNSRLTEGYICHSKAELCNENIKLFKY